MTFDLTAKTIWVAGHTGMVGSAIVRRLETEPIGDLVTAPSSEVDLRRQDQVERFVGTQRPDVLVLAAARVGGIHANQSAQADFLYENLMIAANCIEAARAANVSKILNLGSSCIYPREAPQPMPESALMTGPLEPTNEGYAVAKIAALEMTKMYRRQYGLDAISLMPTNLYGVNDNFDLRTSHVLPALLRKIHEAKVADEAEVEIWGTGAPRREFLHVDDLADAAIFALKEYSEETHLNVGTGEDIAIADLARLIADIVGWHGELRFNTKMPDGAPRKLMDVSRLHSLGWKHQIELETGIESTYRWYLENRSAFQ
ncbi:MAG: GDP-L-fucose synthase family protein [Actinomycetota bacterium]